MTRSKKTMDVKPPHRRRTPRGDRLQMNTAYKPHRETEHSEDDLLSGRKKRRFGWRKALLLIFVLLFLLTVIPLTVLAVWNLRNFSQASQKLFGTSSVFGLLSTKPLETTEGRTNILLTGYSADDPGHGGAELTDSILILSLDKANHTGYMLSVPRDLYVEIPGYGDAKINETYQAGEQLGFQEIGYPAGGMGLLEKVLEDNVGLDIHYYALINYTAVRETVDALGGIDVEIKSDDPRGLYDPNFKPEEGGPLQLANGEQHIDGQTALRLTRARGSTYGSYGFALSDFVRTENQQEVFRGIQSELNWKLVLDPRTNKKIFDAAANNIRTDVELSEVLPLYRLFTAVPSNDIKTYTLRDINGQNLLGSYTTPFGQSALVPSAGIGDFSEIQLVVSQLR